MSLKQLEECYAMGFILEEEYERRKLMLSAELEMGMEKDRFSKKNSNFRDSDFKSNKYTKWQPEFLPRISF